MENQIPYRLTAHQIQDLLGQCENWILSEDAKSIHKSYPRNNFMHSMEIARAIAGLAEQHDHHPDLMIRYRSVDVLLTTHDVGGLSEKDFELAMAIDRLDWG